MNCFSQWERRKFTVDGVEYNCCEQYMMASKARLFDDKEAERRIMRKTHPSDQKALGRLVRNFDEGKWNAVARDFVYEANYAKFTQHEDFKQKLLATAGTTLVEASKTDLIWGIGFDESDPLACDRSNWRGKNWLGEVLTKVRDDIIAGVKSDTFDWK